MTEPRIFESTNLREIKDKAEFSKFLNRLAKQKRKTYYDREWHDPNELKRKLGL